MEVYLSKLPKELLIEIIKKQNISDYYDERECAIQRKKLKKREKMLKEERWKKILESIDHLIPDYIEEEDYRVIKKYIKERDVSVDLVIESKAGDRVIFQFAKILRRLYIIVEEVGVTMILDLDGLKSLNPDFEFLYQHINSKEFIDNIILFYE